MKYYLLITTDAVDINERIVPAVEIIQKRIESRKWPIYHRTNFKGSLAKGDKCLLYVAGTGENAQSFIGEFEIEDISNTFSIVDDPDLLTDTPEKVIAFSKFKLYKSPIGIRNLLDELSFIPENRKRWGASMQGGCKRISETDYAIIVSKEESS